MEIAPVRLFVDGAAGDSGAPAASAGAAAIARTAQGYFVGWLSRQFPPMTNNEAEYRGLLLGLELARHLGVQAVEIVSDSQVVVWQMQGRSQVHSQRLKGLHRQACHQAANFARVRYRHVGREQNRLADALAAEAMEGLVVSMRPLARGNPLARVIGLLRESR